MSADDTLKTIKTIKAMIMETPRKRARRKRGPHSGGALMVALLASSLTASAALADGEVRRLADLTHEYFGKSRKIGGDRLKSYGQLSNDRYRYERFSLMSMPRAMRRAAYVAVRGGELPAEFKAQELPVRMPEKESRTSMRRAHEMLDLVAPFGDKNVHHRKLMISWQPKAMTHESGDRFALPPVVGLFNIARAETEAGPVDYIHSAYILPDRGVEDVAGIGLHSRPIVMQWQEDGRYDRALGPMLHFEPLETSKAVADHFADNGRSLLDTLKKAALESRE